MTVRAQRALRLPADHRSPAAARAVVREVVTEAGMPDVLDEALLLTTELSTNGVIHAGTDLNVEVVADESGVTVTVSDYRGGPVELHTPTAPDALSEHGRGLLLVDQFATAWGTTHDSTGKGVWFRLNHAGASGSAPAAPTTPSSPPPRRPLTPEAAIWLVHVSDELRTRLTLPQLISELLVRLCETTGAASGVVRMDRGDGHGERVLAQFTPHRSTAPTGSEALTVPLPLPRPLRGTLTLSGPNDATGTATPALTALSAERIAIAIESDRLHEADAFRRGWLTYLAEASQLLAQSLDVELTLALIPQIVIPRLGEWCALHMTGGDEGSLELATSSHADEVALPVLKRLLGAEGPTEIAQRLYDAARTQAPSTLPKPLEGVVVPLVARGHVIGTLCVGRPTDRLHSPDDVAVIEDIGRRAALALDNALIHADRKEIAQAFQRALLPVALPVAGGVEFAAEYVPASMGTDVGGDFYDVIELDPGRWLVAVGDVCGKGAQAAALTGMVRDVVRVLVRDGQPLSRTVELLNQALIEQPNEGRYCTLALFLITRNGPELEVECCLAGHDKPLLLRQKGEVEAIGVCGTVVGLLDQVIIEPVRVTLNAGDSLVVYTDGVTERRDGATLYGQDRLQAELAPLAGHSATTVAARLRAAALAFSTEPPRDDLAVLVIRNPLQEN